MMLVESPLFDSVGSTSAPAVRHFFSRADIGEAPHSATISSGEQPVSSWENDPMLFDRTHHRVCSYSAFICDFIRHHLLVISRNCENFRFRGPLVGLVCDDTSLNASVDGADRDEYILIRCIEMELIPGDLHWFPPMRCPASDRRKEMEIYIFASPLHDAELNSWIPS